MPNHAFISLYLGGLLLFARVECKRLLRNGTSSPIQRRSQRVCRLPGACLHYSEGARLNETAALRINFDQNYSGDTKHTASKAVDNLCINGHIAPRFFLLGAQKAATTNFATRLIWVGLSIIPPLPQANEPAYYWKELHVFDNNSRYLGLGVDGWLDYYPECSTTTYAVGIDATPSYISSRGAPSRMAAWYGPQKGAQIQFLVMLRAPFRRMRSSFYTAKLEADACKTNVNFCGSFGSYIRHALDNYRRGCPSGKVFETEQAIQECSGPDDIGQNGKLKGDPFYLSMYVPQLVNWFSIFYSRQFVIAPFLTYVAPKPGVPSLVEFIASRLGSAIKANAATGAIPKRSNASGVKTAYPSLQDSLWPLSAATVQELQTILILNSGSGKIAQVLSPHMEKGLVLFGYTGASGTIDGIGSWIEQNW